ncbi:MAG: UDP-N-acetylmuramoyl-L-alanine--D-glutamate ligase [Acidobacteriota bacterium]|nr:UDP-N-acetylmuramoyl-L-alanine--D-glutamate ligase [Acidobacteriota bacterium]
MSGRPALPGGPYLVLGLARSGHPAALALRERGQEVIGVDAGHPEGVDALRAAGVELHVGWDGEPSGLLRRVRTVVKSPGVPGSSPLLGAARSAGLTVIGELELAWRMVPNEVVAVTGTNGKTTTTELIGHLHRTAEVPVALAGNVGRALSSFALSEAPVDPRATVVCEVSSFQLEDAIAFAPQVAVLLNLTPDHLDRHESLAAYRAAKLSVFARQREGDLALLPAGFAVDLRALGSHARELRFGGSGAGEGFVFERDGMIRCASLAEPLMEAGELSLRGEHNLQNAMAAAAACLARGLPAEAVSAGLASFPGVRHRLEELGRIDGALYVNDSKATNVASTIVALRALCPEREGEGEGGADIHLILGGLGKGQDFGPLAAPVGRCVTAVYLIGEDAPSIERALATGARPLHACGTIERAFERARAAARPGDVVLLSPGCASFDQFADYEARGDRFRELFGSLAREA